MLRVVTSWRSLATLLIAFDYRSVYHLRICIVLRFERLLLQLQQGSVPLRAKVERISSTQSPVAPHEAPLHRAHPSVPGLFIHGEFGRSQFVPLSFGCHRHSIRDARQQAWCQLHEKRGACASTNFRHEVQSSACHWQTNASEHLHWLTLNRAWAISCIRTSTLAWATV